MSVFANSTIVHGGPVQLTWSALGVGVAIVVAVVYSAHVLDRGEFGRDVVYRLALLVLPAGFVGARSFYVADHWSFFSVHLADAVTAGGESVAGGIVGGLAMALIYLRRNRLPVAAIIQEFAAPTTLGLMIGSVGSIMSADSRFAATNSLWFALTWAMLIRSRRSDTWAARRIDLFLVLAGLNLYCLGFLSTAPLDYFGLGQSQIVGVILASMGSARIGWTLTRRRQAPVSVKALDSSSAS